MQATNPHVVAFPQPQPVDSTAAFLREGYEMISNRCRELGVDAFETRLFGFRVVCMRGGEAARLFYGTGNFTRQGVLPPTTLRFLQGKGSVLQLERAAHRTRKEMFMSLVEPASIERLVDQLDNEWRLAVEVWSKRPHVVLYDEAAKVLCRAVCNWTGIPPGEDLERRARELTAVVDGAASFGFRTLRDLYLRGRCNRWARRMIEQVRAGKIILDATMPLVVVAEHRDANGRRLPVDVAAIELVNLLRPVVAIARFIVFSALALYEHPEARATVRAGDEAARARFAQEVRRSYPFIPAVCGRAACSLTFEGHTIERGTWRSSTCTARTTTSACGPSLTHSARSASRRRLTTRSICRRRAPVTTSRDIAAPATL